MNGLGWAQFKGFQSLSVLEKMLIRQVLDEARCAPRMGWR
jgi:hypothetical protein